MKTRSVAAKESESESGYDSRRPRVFEDPPRSPSTIASVVPRIPYGAPAAGTDPADPAFATAHLATAAARRVASTTSDGASAAPAPRLVPASRATATAYDYGESFSTPPASAAPAPRLVPASRATATAYDYGESLSTPPASAALAPRLVPASRATATAHDYGESLSTPPASRYPTTPSVLRPQDSARNTTAAHNVSVRDTASTIRSRRSYCSDVARMKKAEYEAQKRIAAIRKEQLEIEKELVNKRFEYEVSAIEAEAEAREQGSVHQSDDRVDEWLQSIDRSHPQATNQPQREQPPRPATIHVAEETAAYVEPAMRDDDVSPTRDNRRRQRSASRSPTRGERRVGKGIEQLADTLNKMMRVRPPPRQVTELPIFTGAATEWLPFKAAYIDSSSVYNFTAIENLARLRNCVKGDAREAVSALLYTASDPQVVMKTLEQYYGRPEILMDRVMEDLKKLPRLTSVASEVNSFAVKLQNIVCVLSNMDNRGYIWNPMLVREVIENLSPHIKSRWCDYASEAVESSREPEIILLSKFLMREADRAMRYAFTNTTPTPASKKETRSAPQVNVKKRASREVVYTTSDKQEERKIECLCCDGDHEVPKCAKFLKMSVDERWEWARNGKVCFKCVTRRHRREHCRAKRCGKESCSRPHHALLHKEIKETPQSKRPEKATDVENQHSKEAVMTVSASSNTSPRVLLKMCPVILKGPGGEISTFALMDEGSTTSLVDEDLTVLPFFS